MNPHSQSTGRTRRALVRVTTASVLALMPLTAAAAPSLAAPVALEQTQETEQVSRPGKGNHHDGRHNHSSWKRHHKHGKHHNNWKRHRNEHSLWDRGGRHGDHHHHNRHRNRDQLGRLPLLLPSTGSAF